MVGKIMIELVETHIGLANIWSLNFLDTQKNSSGATIPLAGPRIPIFFTGPSIPIFLTGPWIPIFMSARGSLYSDRSKDPFSSISFWPRKFEKLKNLAKLEFRKNKNLGQIIIFNFFIFGQDF